MYSVQNLGEKVPRTGQRENMDLKGIDTITRGYSTDFLSSGRKAIETPWLHYFGIYFKFGFFSFCTPFYFDQNKNNRRYQLSSFPVQKVICVFVQALSLLVLVTNFRIIRSQDLQKNPMLYIELASLALNSFYMVGVIYAFWFKMDLFAQLFAELQSTVMYRFASGEMWKMKLLSTVICTVSILQALISFLYGVEEKEWELDRFLNIMENRGKHMFFIGKGTQLGSTESTIIIGLYGMAKFYGQLMKNTADIVGLLSVLFFRHLLNDLLQAMKDEAFTPQMLQTSYDALKAILNKLNNAVGFFIFFFFLGPVPYYAINIVTMLDASDALLLISNCVYLLNYFTTIILAARVNNSAQDIKDWLTATDRFTQISPPKLDLILHDISEYEIALSGYGFFSASSGLVGTIVSLILTYAILVVQFKAEVTEPGGMEEAAGNISSLLESNVSTILLNNTIST
ncbi:unnamed protein product [Allacma fusca]|uniref:Gustatory receptor n=1 Tax=Allacma fusca TaxID=39272 RepID=A0A8J2PKF3_9HEXA|nr:unnamed protein product [Allacma fusca]